MLLLKKINRTANQQFYLCVCEKSFSHIFFIGDVVNAHPISTSAEASGFD